MPDTLSTVKQIISVQLAKPLEDVKSESLIQEELGANSLDKVEIVIQFEEVFDIVIHDRDAAQIKTVLDAANAIDARVAERGEKLDISF